ncbi:MULTISPECIES: glucokinase [unclassified Rhizobium]|uniref:glucokinase n=1 Tax=unclassified Rhizobium TaxID=2613769 RepID=UPI001ADB5C45|nr:MULTISPECIES: glucokinase [unclassified Rhizobium]MBO9096759.1 glucokinase [Rhizobium sp. L58/93]MBO9134368.1 glucokinase [Rhizobium sp. B209b/85]MBO9167014.1 glucokinase [Rhizobium sp. L245/93]MBO9182986.1 glucokinase [Rhizobium sp. E27B/91]QXZ83352.1 glucokinase [Rhizobium sp. K1/93]
MPKLNHSDVPLPFPVLMGDIGGTNARFSIQVDAYSEAKPFPIMHAADYATIDDAIREGVLSKSTVVPRSAILAVAGPINGDEIPLTNSDWIVRPRTMITDLGMEDVLIINDFEAQALAISNLADDGREPIGAARDGLIASRAVLGPGTGLGVAGLIHAKNSWIPAPGEGGHIDIGPRSKRDLQIWPHLEAIEGRISAEQIICGRGLQNLYRALCHVEGVEPTLKEPADITNHGLAGSDRLAVETLTLFVTYLGRLAGDIALLFMARGGVYLSGGISQKIIPALKKPEFRAAFEDKAPHSAMLRSIPTYVVTHPLAALEGLSSYARMPQKFGLSTEGRRWRR